MLSSIEFSTTEKKQGHERRSRSSATHESRQVNHNEIYFDDTGTSYYGKRETRGRKTVMYRADQ
jgi:hypothetical protein